MENEEIIKEHDRIIIKYNNIIDMYDDIIMELLNIIKDMQLKNERLKRLLESNKIKVGEEDE